MPTGEFETLEADSVILALGQDTDTSFLKTVPGVAFKSDGTVVVGPDMQTGCAGVFAGGDMVPAARTVTTAVGHGKKAARHIDGWLRREARTKPPKHEVATFETLRLWYHTERQRRGQSTIDVERRRHDVRRGDRRARFDGERATRRNAACPAATVSSATAATRPAPSTPSSSSARAGDTSTTWTSARAVRSATTSARAARSR